MVPWPIFLWSSLCIIIADLCRRPGDSGGDMCKEASDLGLPLLGIGFMYPQGYFHQHVSEDGWQQEIFQPLHFNEAPIRKLTSNTGDPVVASLQLAERSVALGVWLVQVGRVPIYLLDTDLPGNREEDRKLSARL